VREVGRISLAEALELTILIARERPGRHPRVAARWLQRYLEERPVGITEAAMVASCLGALAGPGANEAAGAPRAAIVSERAASRRAGP
jgi:hypothetical protein